MSDKERIAQVHARIVTIGDRQDRAGAFDDGWSAGLEWAQEEIARFLSSGQVTYADYAAARVRAGDWSK